MSLVKARNYATVTACLMAVCLIPSITSAQLPPSNLINLFPAVQMLTNDGIEKAGLRVVKSARPPLIVAQPQDQAALLGSNIEFQVSLSGTPPIQYQWRLNGTEIMEGTASTLSITNVGPEHLGVYDVIVSNGGGSVTSRQATLIFSYALSLNQTLGGTVTQNPDQSSYPSNSLVTLNASTNFGYRFDGWSDDEISIENPISVRMDTNKTITANFAGTGIPFVSIDGQKGELFDFTNRASATVELKTTFANGSVFYTLDGSEPGLISPLYTLPFEVTNSVIVRAVAFSTNLFAAHTEPVSINLWFMNPLTILQPHGGTVIRDPAEGPYRNDTVVTLEAQPEPNWTFVRWTQDAEGTERTIAVTMDQAKTVEALFATSIDTIVTGDGRIQFNPQLSSHEYGSVVDVYAIPEFGSFFALWGGEGNGNISPFNLTVTNLTPSVSALFRPLESQQVSLAVTANGIGHVTVSPYANAYDMGATVTVTAVPETNQSFLGWSGHVGGTNTPLAVTMDESKVITANFTDGSPVGSFVLAISPTTHGSVTRQPDQSSYLSNSLVTLMATAHSGFQFDGWSDEFVSTKNPLNVIMDSDKLITPNFVSISGPFVSIDAITASSFDFTNRASAKTELKTTFVNGSVFYTLDGSEPGLSSSLYTSPLEVTNSVIVRAVAFSTNLVASHAEPVPINLWFMNPLTVLAPQGGEVSINPTDGPYRNDTVVTLEAQPETGWTFLQWSLDAAGTEPITTVTMNQAKTVEAIFGTSIRTVVAGDGRVRFNPAHSSYPFGSVVEVYAIPEEGSFFALWGEEGNGNISPFNLTVTNLTPTISALFVPSEPNQVSLAVIANGSGAVTISPQANAYQKGEIVTATAVPETDQNFLGWSGHAGGTNTPLAVTMDGNKVITANFTSGSFVDSFSLVINHAANGSVTRQPDQSTYLSNSLVTLTATANSGFQFDGWADDLVSTENPITISINTNKTVTANFTSEIPTASYALVVNPTSGGTVIRQPDQSTYLSNSLVTLEAVANLGFQFEGWSDDIVSLENPLSVTMDRNTTLTPKFVSIGGPTASIDTVIASRFDFTNRPSATVELKTTFVNGSIFYTLDGSEPGLISSLYTSPLEVTNSITVRAVAFSTNLFASHAEPVPVNLWFLNQLTVSEPQGGAVSIDPAEGPYRNDTVVTLEARPEPGWTFLQWSRDAEGTEPVTTVTMNQAKTVEAIFGTSIKTIVTGDGSARFNPEHSSYPFGSVVEVYAIPEEGNFFALWGEEGKGNISPFNLTVTNLAPTISALFVPLEPNQVSLAVTANGIGDVTIFPQANAYHTGETVTLTAVPQTDQSFLGWSGHAGGTNTPLAVMMDGNKVITANFTGGSFVNSFSLVINQAANGSVIRQPDQNSYLSNSLVTLSATANPGFLFDSWSDDIVSTENPLTITINRDQMITPSFIAIGAPFVSIDGVTTSRFDFTNRSSVSVELRTSFVDGTLLYTLDGSQPGLTSVLYSSPFTLTNSVILRAVALSTNLTPVWRDSVPINFWQTHPLTAATPGGGTIFIDPLEGPYRNDAIITLSAQPEPGWIFQGWRLDASGTNRQVTLTMEQPKSVGALFGTGISIEESENGSIHLNPDSDVYTYGSVVQAYAVPEQGSFFALWGESAHGNTSPFEFVVEHANPAISALFTPLVSGQFSLAVIANGQGDVTLTPPATMYPDGAVVSITAVPKANQRFLSWSGNAAGTDNPLIVVMDGNRVITANFIPGSTQLRLTVPVFDPIRGLEFSLIGEPSRTFVIEYSEDLRTWNRLDTISLGAGGTREVGDPEALNSPQHFYRAVSE